MKISSPESEDGRVGVGVAMLVIGSVAARVVVIPTQAGWRQTRNIGYKVYKFPDLPRYE